MKEKKGVICQSCGMPMQKIEDFGTNADCSRNDEYCHFCYGDGKFTDQGITMEQKIQRNVEIAKAKMNMSEEEARRMANATIPNLKRWRK